jgi:hypothetical protein
MLKLLFQVILNKFKPIEPVAVQEEVTVVKKPAVKKPAVKKPAAKKVAVKKPVKKAK